MHTGFLDEGRVASTKDMKWVCVARPRLSKEMWSQRLARTSLRGGQRERHGAGQGQDRVGLLGHGK